MRISDWSSDVCSSDLYDQVDRPDLKYPAFVPRQLPDVDAIFERVAAGDVLLHHPFDAFTPVLELIRQAADDPSVLAIKQNLYRPGKDPAIIYHLVQSARNGKVRSDEHCGGEEC